MNPLELATRLQPGIRAMGLNPDTVDRFVAISASLSGPDATRINPLDFACRHGLPIGDCIDLFVAASKVGIYDFEWNHICPACGAIQSTRQSLDLLECDAMRCELCDIDVEVSLDDQVEVTFCLNPSMGHKAVDPFSDVEAYRGHYFSTSYVWPVEMLDYLRRSHVDFYPLKAGQSRQVQIEFEADTAYRVMSLDSHSVVELLASPTGDVTAATIELNEDGFKPKQLALKSGVPIALHLDNHKADDTAMMVLRFDLQEVIGILTAHPITHRPFLSAKMLLNSQTFRDLYRVHSLNSALHLNLRSLTLLFTDLKGSTALYDRVGDLEAYRLIQAHFEVLTKVVRRHSGAIIKTMGDAIMASFSTPQHAVDAAIDMVHAIEKLNASMHQGHVLGLKVGLHEGPAVAINADNRVDYFGQTVNIAARVQGLADAGEIVLTDTLYRVPGVAERLGAVQATSSREDANLKGVSHATAVHRYMLADVVAV